MLTRQSQGWLFAASMIMAIGCARSPGEVPETQTDGFAARPSTLSGLLPGQEVTLLGGGQPLDIRLFGAFPNDGRDDSAGIQRACAQAFLYGRQIVIPPGTYDVDQNTTIICTGDLYLFADGDVHFNLDGLLTFRADIADESISLKANVKRKSTSLTVDDTQRCSAGDLLYIDTSVTAESTWGTPKREVHRIKSIPSRTMLTIEEPTAFSYKPTDSGIRIAAYHKRQITIDSVTFAVNDRQLGTQYFSGGTTLRNCRWTERDIGEGDGYHYSPAYSVGVYISGAAFYGGYYGCVPACCRNVVVDEVEGYGCTGHLIAPNNWCYGVYVYNVSGSDCGSLVDSHPSFQVHYSGVSGTITGLPNLRSLGGSVRGYSVESTQSDSTLLSFQEIALLVDTDIYDETVFTLEDFTLKTPNLDPANAKSRAVVRYGCQAVLRNVDWWWCDFYPGPNWSGPTTGFHTIDISGCTLARLSLWRDERTTISACRFVSKLPQGDSQNVALAMTANVSCSATNASFEGYTYVMSLPSAQNVSFTRCQFTDCDSVFATASSPPRVTFDSCTFNNVSRWGAVDTRNLQVRNCTFKGTAKSLSVRP